MMRAHLIPAYSRDYKSKAEVEAALLCGADFLLTCYDGQGGYCNLETLHTMGAPEANVRYARQTRVHVVNVPKLWWRYLAGDRGEVKPRVRKPKGVPAE